MNQNINPNYGYFQNGAQSLNQNAYYANGNYWNFKLFNNHENDPLYFKTSDASKFNRQFSNYNSDYQTSDSSSYMPSSSLSPKDYTQKSLTMTHPSQPVNYASPVNPVFSNSQQTSQANEVALGCNRLFYSGETSGYSTDNHYDANRNQRFIIEDQSLIEINGQHYLKVIQENLIPIHNHRYYPMLEMFLKENENDNRIDSKFKNYSNQPNSTKLVENVSLTNFLIANDGNLFGNYQLDPINGNILKTELIFIVSSSFFPFRSS